MENVTMISHTHQTEKSGEATAVVVALRDALYTINQCFEAAYFEGLSEAVDTFDRHEPGSLSDLVNRRLIPARETAIVALATTAAFLEGKPAGQQPKHSNPKL